MNTRNWGTIALLCECGSFAVYALCFLAFRLDLPHSSLLSFSGPVPRWCVRLVLISGAIAVYGLFRDKARARAIATLLFLIPALVLMGILRGHW